MLHPNALLQAVRSPGFVIPSPPTNCVAGAFNLDTVKVTWEDNSRNETAFEIFRDGSLVHTTGAHETSWQDSGLAAGVYEYKVRAKNNAGTSAFSDPDSTTVEGSGGGGGGATIPLAPTGLSVTTTGDTTQSLSWTDNSSDEDGFRIYRNVSSTPFDTVGADVTSYNASGLEEGSSNTWEVSAFNTAGESAKTDAVTKTTELTPPSGLSWSGDGLGFVTLYWDDNSAKETEYQIYKDGSLWNTVDADTTEQITSEAGDYKVRAAAGSIPDSDFTSTVTITQSDLDSGGSFGPNSDGKTIQTEG